MGKEGDDRSFEEIAELIRKEKEQALEFFRQGNFDQSIRAGVAALSSEERGRFVRRAVVPVSVAVLIVVSVVSVLLLSRRSITVHQDAPGLITAVLGDLPGTSDLVVPRETSPPAAMPAFGPAQALRTVLALATEQKSMEERKAGFPAGITRVPRLSLEKKMEILFKDKAIERVLVSIQRKSEEV